MYRIGLMSILFIRSTCIVISVVSSQTWTVLYNVFQHRFHGAPCTNFRDVVMGGLGCTRSYYGRIDERQDDMFVSRVTIGNLDLACPHFRSQGHNESVPPSK